MISVVGRAPKDVDDAANCDGDVCSLRMGKLKKGKIDSFLEDSLYAISCSDFNCTLPQICVE